MTIFILKVLLINFNSAKQCHVIYIKPALLEKTLGGSPETLKILSL